MNHLNQELLISFYPNITSPQIKLAIKYQEKFSLTLENLKCLNPNCNEVRKWFNTKWGFGHTCGQAGCKESTKDTVIKIGLEKNKHTYFERTGYYHNAQNPETRERTSQTYFERTGYLNPGHNPNVIQKREETCLLKYGVKHNSQNSEIKKKKQKSFMDKYSSTHFKNSHITNYQYWYDYDFWIKEFLLEDMSFDNKKCMTFFNCTKDTVNTKILELNIYRKKTKTTSLAEEEILNYLNPDNFILNSQNIIKPLELDIYIPDKQIAIEYNGIYWHSYMNKDNAKFGKQTDIRYCKQRHLLKTEACQKQGIQLFHIFENEWQHPVKQEIWKSVLANALGKSKRIGARKCIMKPVPKKDIRPFLEQNHLQGYGVSPIAYGLYYKDELMSIMTFASGKGRMDIKTDWELVRFCNKRGYNVQGAASRLLKAFRAEYPGSIKSYANRRWSNGNLYRMLGFKETGISAPNHFYWHLSNSKSLISRQNYQKHKLQNKLEIYDKSLSALQNMINNKFAIIWDSGNYTFILK